MVSQNGPNKMAQQWLADGQLWCIMLPVCPCVVLSKLHQPDMHKLLRQVASILVASSPDTSNTPDFLVTCQRHPREDVTRMLRRCQRKGFPWNLSLDVESCFELFHEILDVSQGQGYVSSTIKSSNSKLDQKLVASQNSGIAFYSKLGHCPP